MPAGRPTRVARLALFTMLGLLACRRASDPSRAATVPAAPPPPSLGPVTLRNLSEGVAPVEAVDFSPIEETLRRRLLASGLFATPDAGAAPVVVRVHGDVELDGADVEDKGVARAAVRLKLDTRPSEAPGAIDEELAGRGEQIYPIRSRAAHAKASSHRPAAAPPAITGEKRALFSRLVERVAGDLIDGFVAREKLRTANAATLHAALRSDGGELQESAIRIAGERKLRGEVPVLLDLLDNPSEPVRDAALGALIQIGDRRAVTALAKSRSLRDRREMRKILEAIATLGGDEALDYLSFVAASHDDEEIRAIAAAAKGRLERRRGPDAGGARPPTSY